MVVFVTVWLRGCIVRPAADHPGRLFDRGQNATWLGIEWVNEKHTESEIAELAKDLRQRQIVYLYVYVSYLRSNGTFGSSYAYAADFVSSLKHTDPNLKVLAWYGIPTNQVDWHDQKLRAVIADFSKLMVESMIFDGIQIDAEPIANNDTELIPVLDAIRQSIGQQAILSVATPAIWPIVPDWLQNTNSILWSAAYYREIARHTDQIAVMTYDSTLPLPVLYRLWLRFQVIQISKAVDGSKAQLFIGIPTSEEETFTHHAYTENMTSGLQGVIDGLNDSEAQPDSVTGVAIYPYWETTADEWTIYQSLWLSNQP